MKALEIMRIDERQSKRLWDNTQYIRKALASLGFDLMGSEGPIIPILVGDTDAALQWYERLMREGICVPAIRPPTVPKGTDRLRVTITAKHTKQHLDRLTKALGTGLKKIPRGNGANHAI